MPYCIYLRKSRSDIEAEAHGEEETLARHERMLLELAKKGKYDVTQIYREVVSGETITSRPVMQLLLSEVESNMWDGVLVVEVERLARGDTIDQGLVAQTFKYSGTKIITPMKIYDPENEFDEEYFEFGLFMSRREYKTINRRLQRGREEASKEGKIVSGSCPYGYDRVRCSDGKGWTLVPNDEQAEVVKMIFNFYTNPEETEDGNVRRIGAAVIANRLNAFGIDTPRGGSEWTPNVIRKILRNPVYIGKVRWGHRRTKRFSENGSVCKKRVFTPPEEWIVSDGLHPAIIDEDVFKRANEILASSGPTPVKNHCEIRNPFAGIIRCQKCGRLLVRKTTERYSLLLCPNRHCDNVGADQALIEERIIQALSEWLKNYRLEWSKNTEYQKPENISAAEKSLRKSEKNLENLRKQLSNTHDLLERGIYDTDTFLSRSRELSERIIEAENTISSLSDNLNRLRAVEENRVNIVPKVENLLEVYDTLPNAAAKNELLKEVLERVEYLREVRSPKGGQKDNFEVTIFPKLPHK